MGACSNRSNIRSEPVDQMGACSDRSSTRWEPVVIPSIPDRWEPVAIPAIPDTLTDGWVAIDCIPQ